MSGEVLPALTGRSRAVVVFLHGLGDSGAGLSDIGRLAQRTAPWIKFVFPDAPIRQISVNGGMKMRAWFDIRDFNGNFDRNQVAESARLVEDIVRKQMETNNKVFLCGFSQGAMVTTYIALTSSIKYAGFAALSSALVEPDSSKLSTVNKDTPFFSTHGTADPILTFQRASDGAKKLVEKYGLTNYTFKTYDGEGHTISTEMLEGYVAHLKKCLPQDETSEKL